MRSSKRTDPASPTDTIPVNQRKTECRDITQQKEARQNSDMTAKVEILGLVLGLIGLTGTLVITGLPNWRVTAFIGANLIVMEKMMEGLWMDCYQQANFRMQCKVYDSLLILPPELQASRALICVCIFLSLVGSLVTGCGMRATTWSQENRQGKNITILLGGCLFLLSCIVTIIPVSWVTYTIIQNFYNPLLIDSMKRELGECLFVGWTNSGLFLAAGVILIWCFTRRRKEEDQYYSPEEIMDMMERKPSQSPAKIEYV